MTPIHAPRLRRFGPGDYRYGDLDVYRVKLWDGWWWVVRRLTEDGTLDWSSDPFQTLREAKAFAVSVWGATHTRGWVPGPEERR